MTTTPFLLGTANNSEVVLTLHYDDVSLLIGPAAADMTAAKAIKKLVRAWGKPCKSAKAS